MSNDNKSPGEEKDFPGYPHHPSSDDIYKKEKKEPLEPEDDDLDMGLDVPGSELDDTDELIGEEDEENNYYSIGGDNHSDLEEDDEEAEE